MSLWHRVPTRAYSVSTALTAGALAFFAVALSSTLREVSPIPGTSRTWSLTASLIDRNRSVSSGCGASTEICSDVWRLSERGVGEKKQGSRAVSTEIVLNRSHGIRPRPHRAA